MDNQNDHLGRTPLAGDSLSCVIGYIFCPDQDREGYIRRSLLLNRCAIITEDGNMIKNVRLSKSILPYVLFPSDTRKYGSPL